jgi:hypothetical protein
MRITVKVYIILNVNDSDIHNWHRYLPVLLAPIGNTGELSVNILFVLALKTTVLWSEGVVVTPNPHDLIQMIGILRLTKTCIAQWEDNGTRCEGGERSFGACAKDAWRPGL